MSCFDEEPDGDPHGECAIEIERLNAQVAMHRKFLAYIQGAGRFAPEDFIEIDDFLSQTQSEWLATHDAKVRDDALEEASNTIQLLIRSKCGMTLRIRHAESMADEIRAMKGTK